MELAQPDVLDGPSLEESISGGDLLQRLYSARSILVTGVDPDDELLLRIASTLGKPQLAHPLRARSPQSPHIKVQKAGEQTTYDASYWHADRNYGVTLAKATVIQCQRPPEAGGATEICDTASSWAALAPDVRATLEDWVGIYNITAAATLPAERKYADRKELARLKDFSEPVVISHPATLEHAISFAERYIEFDSEENDLHSERSRLDSLLAIVENGHAYAHSWATGDILIWDNHATMHRGRPVLAGQKVTHRIVVS